jgi:protoporphyrinogen oxidase
MNRDLNQRSVLIIGAGPAGLTAAIEVLDRGRIPLVVEVDSQVGGIAKTVVYRGNRIDIGGHRFFSKTDSVVDWWLDLLPLERGAVLDDSGVADTEGPDPAHTDAVMLSRSRLSRILFLRHFFSYPVSLTASTIRNLGLMRTAHVGMSYLGARLRPIRPERNLEDFMVNRFGRELYQLFFRDYTEKVWGVPCTSIGPEWGAQRIKGISVASALKHAFTSTLRTDQSVRQRGSESSLISRFLYPKLGPGQLWETVALRIEERGGSVMLQHEVVGVCVEEGRVARVRVRDGVSGEESLIRPSMVLSSMPIADLVARIEGEAPGEDVRRIASGLPYRDFMTAGLLVSEMLVSEPDGSRIRDNWIYVQDHDVRMGRLQVFNNWSPYMVADEKLTWLGLEYFCNEGDELWEMPDDDFVRMAAVELERIGIARAEDVVDSVALRVKKAYPAYFGTYSELAVVRDYLDSVGGLYVMGRNGTHRYNNMDHSMLSARAAVLAAFGEGTRAEIWNVNADEEYQESK